jgi:hypothetical protein
MAYRPLYLLARALHQMRRDPAAFGLLVGFLSAVARRSPQMDDAGARAVLRADQSMRRILQRRDEAVGSREREVRADPRQGRT